MLQNHVGATVSPSHDVIRLLFQFKFWWLDQHLIPDMWLWVFVNISIYGWVINSD